LLTGVLAQQTLKLRDEVQSVVNAEAAKHQSIKAEFTKFVTAIKVGTISIEDNRKNAMVDRVMKIFLN
jgi:hypothetical protein